MRITTNWIRFFFIKKKECSVDKFVEYKTVDGSKVRLGFTKDKKLQSVEIMPE